jgi:hypothetical protein
LRTPCRDTNPGRDSRILQQVATSNIQSGTSKTDKSHVFPNYKMLPADPV